MKKIWLTGILLAVPLAVVGLSGCGTMVPAVLAPGIVSANNTSPDASTTSTQAIIAV